MSDQWTIDDTMEYVISQKTQRKMAEYLQKYGVYPTVIIANYVFADRFPSGTLLFGLPVYCSHEVDELVVL